MTPPLNYPWDSSAFVQPSPIRDYTKPLDFSAPATLDMGSLAGSVAKYGPTPSFTPGTPIGDTYSYMGGDMFMPAAVPRPAAPSSWFGGVFDGATDTLKSANKWMQDVGLIGGKDDKGNTFNGWGGLALGAAQGLGSIYMGMKQYELQKDSLNFQKNAFNKNYAAQKSQINSQLEDRQRARVASNSGAYQSVGDYMNQYGVR